MHALSCDYAQKLYAYNYLYEAHHMIVLGNYMHGNICIVMVLSVHGNFICVKMCIYANMCLFFANKMCVNMCIYADTRPCLETADCDCAQDCMCVNMHI